VLWNQRVRPGGCGSRGNLTERSQLPAFEGGVLARGYSDFKERVEINKPEREAPAGTIIA
jgi:hypothetical protein